MAKKKEHRCWKCGEPLSDGLLRHAWEKAGQVNTFRVKCMALVESEAGNHQVKCGAINVVEVAFKLEFKVTKPE